MDEQIKQPLMVGVIAGGLSVIAYQLLFNLQGQVMGFVWAILLGLVIGGIAFGITFVVMKNR